MISLANALLPSIRAAAADGPKQAMPRSRTASATPATSGASGPTTTRPAPSATARSATARGEPASTARRSSAGMPALPGATTTEVTAGSAVSARKSACSRAPEPTTRTSTSAHPSGAPGSAGSARGEELVEALQVDLDRAVALADHLAQAVDHADRISSHRQVHSGVPVVDGVQPDLADVARAFEGVPGDPVIGHVRHHTDGDRAPAAALGH